jgi:peptidoglycan/LPS O-acetylase OafA/YrhL
MVSFSAFSERFRRVTTSTGYLPEIDGLRFIAIFMVVCILHVGGTYAGMMFGDKIADGYLQKIFIKEGKYGVSLFFIISGFILSIPFAKQKLYGQKPVLLKDYFIRRLTRIEPLYIITLVLYFIIRVWVLHYQSFAEVVPHFIASFFYVHNIVYNDFSLINGVTWSLEVEIQFYCLAPLLTSVYLVKSTLYRRIIFVILITGGCIVSYIQQYQMGNFINCGCYFFAGMLLAELYLSDNKTYNKKYHLLLAGVALVSVFTVPAYFASIYFCLAKIILTCVFFFLSLKNSTLKKYLGNRVIAITGGMCYSIYLLHMGVHGVLRHKLTMLHFSKYNWVNGWAAYLITIFTSLIISAVFFILIEKPTMKKGWYKIKMYKNKQVVYSPQL